MKIARIKNIKNYKSFVDFNWTNFFNNEEFNQNMNIFYGENGSGKTSICNFFKSISGFCEFEQYIPADLCIETESNSYVFNKKTGWDNQFQQNSIIFFDKDFINKNIHLGQIRGRHQGEHEQESGKLIIEFDQKAIQLRNIRNNEKVILEDLISKKKDFENDNESILSFELTELETTFYNDLKNKSEKEINNIKKDIEKEKNIIQNDLDKNIQLQSKVTEIQNITNLQEPNFNYSISKYEKYDSLFRFQLQIKSIANDQRKISKLVEKYQDFFSKGFKIRSEEPGRCPFCQSNLVEKDIVVVERVFNQVFDKSYENSVKDFINLKTELVNELDEIISKIDNTDIQGIMLALKELENKFSINNIYSTEEEKSFEKPTYKKIEELKNKLNELEKPINEDISDVYKGAKTDFLEIKKYSEKLVEFIKNKNKIINKFKENSTNEKLAKSIEETEVALRSISNKKLFLENCMVGKQKLKEKKAKELEKIAEEIKAYEGKYKKAKSAYEDYVSHHAYQNLLNKISKIFKDTFNLSFSLEIDTDARRIDKTKEFPFAFKVLDSQGNERDFKDGISDGERQILSLCFFFAFLEIQEDKNKKIVVFDDPITSLDNNNLLSLVRIIGNVCDPFAQIFIFTHHRLFFKFLQKRYSEKNCSEFNILRNKKEFGGSFICKSGREKFINKLRNIEQYLVDISKGKIDIELIIVEYGQYLRYEVERFVKNELLQWNKSDNFGNAIEGVKKNKTISDDDLDRIKEVYSFCNWTTSHVDVGEDHGLEQLKQNINTFIPIIEGFS